MSEITRKRAYVRRSCPKGTTKATDHAFCRTALTSHTHTDRCNMHDMSAERASLTRARLSLPSFILLSLKGCLSFHARA